MSIVYARDFRIRLFLSNFRIDSLFGTIGYDGKLYLSSYDIGCILRKKDAHSWSEKIMTCRYKEIGNTTDVKRERCPMITNHHLIFLLKTKVADDKEARYLYELLVGGKCVHFGEMIHNEHVLTCCMCTYHRGIPFKFWVQCHRNILFSFVPITTYWALKSKPNPSPASYPPDFKIILYMADFRIDHLLGTVGKDGALYFSLYHVGTILNKKYVLQWCEKKSTCFYEDISLESTSKKNHFMMMHYDDVMMLLKEERNYPKEAKFVYHLLSGKKNVKYENIIHRQHVMNCCGCGQFYGINFTDWIWKHKANLLRYDMTSTPYSPKT